MSTRRQGGNPRGQGRAERFKGGKRRLGENGDERSS